eukprot:gene28752-31934_t
MLLQSSLAAPSPATNSPQRSVKARGTRYIRAGQNQTIGVEERVRDSDGAGSLNGVGRRAALLLGLSFAVTQPLLSARDDGFLSASHHEESISADAALDDSDGFYSRWKFSTPSDILPFIFNHAKRGDAEGVLRVIDAFNLRYPLNIIGPEKGAMLESLVSSSCPERILALGTYVGYSTLRMARSLEPGASLVCVEASEIEKSNQLGLLDLSPIRSPGPPSNLGTWTSVLGTWPSVQLGHLDLEACHVAKEVLTYAGLYGKLKDGRRVVVEQGQSNEAAQAITAATNSQRPTQATPTQADTIVASDQPVGWGQGPANFVFEDHCMSCYLPDLLTLESTGLIDEGTVVVAGNVVFPGAPDFLKYLRDPRNGYAASMVAARFQFDEGTVVAADNVVFPGAPDYLNYLRDPRNGYASSMGTVVVADNVVFPEAPDSLSYLRDPRNGYAASMVAARFQFNKKWDPSSTSRPDALAVAVRGRPTHDNATDSLRPTATLNSPPAFALGGKQSLYDSFPSTRLRGAVAKLQDVCREIPNGKRCAPIPVHYTRSA